MSKKNSKRRKQTDPELNLLEQDENFYFIAGYTSGGAPYGITWEEAAEINHSIQQLNCTVFSKIMKEFTFRVDLKGSGVMIVSIKKWQ